MNKAKLTKLVVLLAAALTLGLTQLGVIPDLGLQKLVTDALHSAEEAK